MTKIMENKKQTLKVQADVVDSSPSTSTTLLLSVNDFVDGTSLHGLKYAFQGNGLTIRRVLWLMCILGATGLLIAQLVLRIEDFLEYNTNIDIKQIKESKLIFPAVTICNHNRYRMTSAAMIQADKFIQDVYRTQKNNVKWQKQMWNKYSGNNFTNMTLSNFSLFTAHTLEDLIESCEWEGRKCERGSFVLVPTNYGVCYTFNSGKIPNTTLYASYAGLSSGLRLVLNSEQYEYMEGPQIEAGVKILLHDQSEVPLVRDFGFSVPPGTNTLVAVKRVERENLPQPWGGCVHYKDGSNLPACLTDCSTNVTTEYCGCKDLYMEGFGNDSVPVCGIKVALMCIGKNVDTFQRATATSCDCKEPCVRAIYEPSLSYSNIASKNAGNNIGAKGSNALRRKFLGARNTLQRIDTAIVASDTIKLYQISNYSQSVEAMAESLLEDLNVDKPGKLFQKYQLISAYEAWSTIYSIDNYHIQTTISRRSERFDKNYVQEQTKAITELESAVQNIKEFLMEDDKKYDLPNIHWTCALRQVYSSGNLSVDCTDSSWPSKSYKTFTKDTKATAKGTKRVIKDLLTTIESLTTLYNVTITGVFGGHQELKDRFAGKKSQHMKCTLELDTLWQKTNKTYHLTDDYINAVGAKLANESAAISHKISKLSKDLDKRIDLSHCTWVIAELESRKETMLKLREKVMFLDFPMIGARAPLYDSLRLIQLSQKQFRKLKKANDDYLGGRIEKTKLANTYGSRKIQQALATMNSRASELMVQMNDYVHYCGQLKTHVRPQYELNIYFTPKIGHLPLYYRKHLKNLQLTKNAARIDSTIFYEQNSTNATGQELLSIYNKMSNDFKNHVENMTTTLTEEIKKELLAISEIRDKMSAFETENKMDSEFFLKNFLRVDIFYQELSYERIVQQEALGIVSLVSEVGGLMGLLIGASVMSIFELIDFLCVILTLKCRQSTLNTMESKGKMALVRDENIKECWA